MSINDHWEDKKYGCHSITHPHGTSMDEDIFL